MEKLVKKILRKIISYANKGQLDYILWDSTFAELPNIGSQTKIYKSEFGSHNAISSNCYLDKCKINDFTYIAENSSIINTEIGKFCSIGRNAGICLGNHPSHTFVSTHPSFFSPAKQSGYTFANESYFDERGKVLIGNDVWIGANVVIMNDVKIGDGAIIGAGAVVTKDVPPYAIVVGVPGKILKYRFQEDEISLLVKTKWWDLNNDFIQKNFKKFHDINDFKKLIQNDL